MRKAIILGSHILINVVFLLGSAYLWLSLGTSLRYDLYGYNYSSLNYDLLNWIFYLFGLSSLVIELIILSHSKLGINNIIKNKAILPVSAFLLLYDLYVFITAIIINDHLVQVGSSGFLRQFSHFIVPPILAYNFLSIIACFGVLLITRLTVNQNHGCPEK